MSQYLKKDLLTLIRVPPLLYSLHLLFLSFRGPEDSVLIGSEPQDDGGKEGSSVRGKNLDPQEVVLLDEISEGETSSSSGPGGGGVSESDGRVEDSSGLGSEDVVSDSVGSGDGGGLVLGLVFLGGVVIGSEGDEADNGGVKSLEVEEGSDLGDSGGSSEDIRGGIEHDVVHDGSEEGSQDLEEEEEESINPSESSLEGFSEGDGRVSVGSESSNDEHVGESDNNGGSEEISTNVDGVAVRVHEHKCGKSLNEGFHDKFASESHDRFLRR